MLRDQLSAAKWPGLLAMIGISFVLVMVPLFPDRTTFGGLPLDKVILSVPIGILLSVPLLSRTRSQDWPHIGIELPASLFLGWAMLSTLFTGAEPGMLATWTRYAAYIILVYAVAAIAIDKGRLRAMLWILTLSGSATALYACYQYMNPREFIGMWGLYEGVATRVFSTFVNPNFFAEFLILLIATSLGLFFTEKGYLRTTVSALLIVQIIALLLTFTRGSWVALLIGLAIALLLIDFRLLPPFVFGGAAVASVIPGVLDRFLSVFSLEGSSGFRLGLWRVAGDAMAERPIFGMGPGRFYDAFTEVVMTNPEHTVGYLFVGAHQSYFQLGTEVGIIGGIAFGWMVFRACRMGFFYNARIDGDRGARLWNASLSAGIIAFAFNGLTSGAFQHPQAAVFFFVLLGMQAGNGSRFWDRSDSSASRSVGDPEGVWGSSLVGGILSRVMSGAAVIWRASLVGRTMVKKPIGSGHILPHSVIVKRLLGLRDTTAGDTIAHPR